jgi:hypothetical protein
MRGCAAEPRQRSPSQIRVLRDSWPYFTVSNLRLPHPGGQASPIIPPGTGYAQTVLILLHHLAIGMDCAENPIPSYSIIACDDAVA